MTFALFVRKSWTTYSDAEPDDAPDTTCRINDYDGVFFLNVLPVFIRVRCMLSNVPQRGYEIQRRRERA